MMILQKRAKNKITKVFNSVYPRIQYRIGKLKGDNVVYTYFFSKVINFGDLLTPILLKNYGLKPIFFPIDRAEIVVVGSVLQSLPEEFSGFILGSGLIEDVSRSFPYASILALRGELTRDRIGAPLSTVLGDPGLLAHKLITTRQEKQFVLGIVQHYVDNSDKRIHNICQRNNGAILNIDVQREPLDVISDIDKCNFIMSSSLHGLIVADSLGIPNAWITLSNKVKGNGFKFYDYASAFGMKYEPQYLTGYETLNNLINMTHKVDAGIQDVKSKLDTVFNRVKRELQ
ncbi:MAG: polysaccharide pyruvyl transferase family protein [Anaerolineae bacterium]|nr:polysaccharide pyruvyl transferase family protein [Anaerolineae bacterium]